ncbi:hypothetical protein DIPPA_17106 [Diplonema papillatum]|nr:hypothetical protein DIPPA_17106 [Diplonema papillatum]|eukprot:gene20852-32158_t
MSTERERDRQRLTAKIKEIEQKLAAEDDKCETRLKALGDEESELTADVAALSKLIAQREEDELALGDLD